MAYGWLRIDLGASYAIHGVEIFTAEKEGANANDRKEEDRNYEVRIGNDGEVIENNPTCATFGDPYVARHESAYCEKELCGRYITIQRNHPSVDLMHVCEFLAFSLDQGRTCTIEAPTTTTTTTT